MKIEEKYNSVVVHLRGKLFGGTFEETMMSYKTKILHYKIIEMLGEERPARRSFHSNLEFPNDW